MTEFGENLERLLTERKISARELAKQLDVPAKSVQEWVGKGARVPRDLDVIQKLATIFDISVHQLLYGTEDPRSPMSKIFEKVEIHSGLYEISIKKVVGK